MTIKFYLGLAPIQELNIVLCFIGLIDQDNFCFALESKNYDEKDIERLYNDLQARRISLENTVKHLEVDSSDWLYRFCTEDNSLYTNSESMLKKIGSGVSAMEKFAKRLNPRKINRDILPYGYTMPTTWQTSRITTTNPQLYLFDSIYGYPPCVHNLLSEVLLFRDVLSSGIKLCQDIIKKEKEIKGNDINAKRVFDLFKSQVLAMTKDANIDINLLTDNPMVQLWYKYDGSPKFYSAAYHLFCTKYGKEFIWYLHYRKGESIGLSKQQIHVFGNNPKIIAENDYIILHFDEIINRFQVKEDVETMPAKYIVMYVMSSDSTSNFKEAFGYFLTNYKGNYTLPKDKAIYSARNKVEKGSTEYKKFQDYRADILNYREKSLVISTVHTNTLEFSRLTE